MPDGLKVIVSNAGHPSIKGLMGILEENWQKQHQIFFDEKAPPIPTRNSAEATHVFKPKDCMKLGFCRCEAPGKQAFVFWKKMCKSFKGFFTKGSTNRSKLDSGMAVLKLQSFHSLAFASEQSLPLYFHVGYINLKTWHFTLLRLQPRGPCLANGVQPLELQFDDGKLSVELAAKTFCELDLAQVWECRICFLVQRRQAFLEASQMMPHHVEVLSDPDAEPVFSWKGWETEKPKPRNRKRKLGDDGNGKNEKPARKMPKTRKTSDVVVDDGDIVRHEGAIAELRAMSEQERQEHAKYLDGVYNAGLHDADISPSSFGGEPLPNLENDLGNDEDADTDTLHESDDLGSQAGDDDDSDSDPDQGCDPWRKAAGEWLDLAEADLLLESEEALPDPEPNVEAPGDLNLGVEPPLQRSLVPDFEQTLLSEPVADETAKDVDMDFNELQDQHPTGDDERKSNHSGTEKASSKCTDDFSISDDNFDPLADEGDSISSSSSDSDLDVDPATRKKATGTVDDRFNVPNGSIRFNFQTHNLVAHCEVHGNNCRRTRTCKPSARKGASSKGQGRPIGHLTAWLARAKDFPSNSAHSSGCHPSREDRRAGRATFNGLPGSKEFSQQYERPRVDDESEEPFDFP